MSFFFNKHPLLAPLLLIVITFLLFYQTHTFEFLAIDDGMHTEANPRISPLTLSNVLSFWTTPYEKAYTPLTYTLWALQAAVAVNTPLERALSKTSINPKGTRFKPGVFHLGNLLIHIGTVLAVYFLIKSFFTGSFIAFIGSLFFAVHPLQVESVCWITGFRDVLAGFFSITALYFYFQYCKLNNADESYFSYDSLFTRKYLFYAVALFSFLLGVLCKSSALMTPFMAAPLVFILLKRKPLYLAIDFLPWLALLMPILQVFFGLNDSVALHVTYQPELPMRLFIALDSIAFYLGKILLPLSIATDYGRTPQYVLRETNFYLTACIPIILTLILAFFAWKKKNIWPFTLFIIFVIGLAPILGLTPFIYQHISTVADRYVYLSMLAPSIFLSWFFLQYQSSKPVFYSLVLMLCLLFLKSFLQIPTWKNNKTIFTQALKVTPNSWISANNLGTFYEGEEKTELALSLYEKAAVLSDIPSAWNNAAAMAFKLKQYAKSVSFFERALETSHGDPWAHHNLGLSLKSMGKNKEAQEHFKIALQRDPRLRLTGKKITAILRNEEQIDTLAN